MAEHALRPPHTFQKRVSVVVYRLALFFQTTAEFWMALQSNYDLSLAMEKSGDDIKRSVHNMQLNEIKSNNQSHKV
ncbi:MAG: hypothetical protein HQL69_01585 [Magnetococcales bacterium]|nr:hypothetical protein [Magnetococcales bacterium]